MKAMRYISLFAAVILASCASTPKQAQLEAAAMQANQLDTQLRSLQYQIMGETDQINSLNSQIADLHKTNADLTASLNAVQDYEAQISTLNKEKADLQAQVSQLQTQNGMLASQAQAGAQDLNSRIAQLNQIFSKEIAQGLIDIRQYRGVLIVSVKDSVFFVPDWPILLKGGQDILSRLAPVLKEDPSRIIRVEGNTAVAPSSAASLRVYPTSWYLGAARAAAVVQYLQDTCGVDPLQLVATTFGQYRPVADNTTEAGREKNRRVDFVLVPRALFEPGQLPEAMATTAQAPGSSSPAQ